MSTTTTKLTRAERSAANKALFAAKRAAELAQWEARRAHRVLVPARLIPTIGGVIEIADGEYRAVDTVGRVWPSHIGPAAWVYYGAVPVATQPPLPVDTARAIDVRGKCGKPPRKPINLMRFLAANGGLNPASFGGSDLKYLNANVVFVPGHGKLVRAPGRGMALDRALSAAIEAGYLGEDSYISDLIYWIDEEMRGHMLYPPRDHGLVVQWEQYERVQTSAAREEYAREMEMVD